MRPRYHCDQENDASEIPREAHGGRRQSVSHARVIRRGHAEETHGAPPWRAGLWRHSSREGKQDAFGDGEKPNFNESDPTTAAQSVRPIRLTTLQIGQTDCLFLDSRHGIRCRGNADPE
jgi:hypothetical protein